MRSRLRAASGTLLCTLRRLLLTGSASVDHRQDSAGDVEILLMDNRAIDSLENGQDSAAVNKFEAFINQVQAQRGKKLTDEEADKLIADVQAIIDYVQGN